MCDGRRRAGGRSRAGDAACDGGSTIETLTNSLRWWVGRRVVPLSDPWSGRDHRDPRLARAGTSANPLSAPSVICGDLGRAMMDSNIESRISDSLAALHGHWNGKSPPAARTYIAGGDVVVVVLEETFTPAEQALVDRGAAGEIQEIRRRFRRVVADEFAAIVEQATGRRVRSYISDTDLAENVSIDVFLLGAPLEDMSGFEEAGGQEVSGGS